MNEKLLIRLYQNYHHEIYVYLCSLCKNVDLAEDLTQETFLKALLSLSSSHTNMRAWLYMVARNLYFNYEKKHSKITSLEECEEETAILSEESLSTIILEENKRQLFAAMEQLDDRYREILTLQYFGELSLKEIAKTLNTSPENARVLSHRAKQKLKKKLEELHYEL